VAPEDPEQLVRDVSRKIQEIRRGRGLTQEQAAERLGISVRAYAYLESGQNLTLETLARVAAVLEVRAVDLLAPPASREVRRGRPKKGPA
jgi:transcriptional regulator with XRE-family HTH domain